MKTIGRILAYLVFLLYITLITSPLTIIVAMLFYLVGLNFLMALLLPVAIGTPIFIYRNKINWK